MLSRIQTKRHWLRKVVFEVNDERILDSEYQANLTLRHAKRENHWYVSLNVAFAGKDSSKANYKGQIEFEGIFDIHPEFPEDKTDDLVRMNGGAILYGAVREYVLGLTARSKHGPFEMPTIDARMFLKAPEPSKEPESETKPE
ncbi:MAG: protein-export chaperone SecB [Verrucomicrobia bacterium]|nr:protein-export chaperone SecB [Verrucomicrobiota bacterium]